MQSMRSPLFLIALLAAGPSVAQPGGVLPSPLPLFPADHWWNADVRNAPVDPGSAGYLARIGLNTGLHPDFGGDAGFPEIYGLPYVVVPGSQPLVPVTFVEFGDESDAGAPGRPPGYPIPEEAKTQAHYLEGGFPGNASASGDRHLLLVDRDHRLLFELYHARFNAVQSRWEAGSGAVFSLDSNARRPEGWTSADAAGLAILPGLVRYDEVASAEPIRHAFRVTIEETDGHVFPASHTAGDTAGALPMGARLRLKASKDLSPYPPEVRKIFVALQTYGLLVADNGSDLFIGGTYDPRWDNDVLNPAFASLHAGDFEVVQLGWQPAAAGCTASDTRLCLAGGRFEVKADWTTGDGQTGPGHAIALTGDTGYFWFFNPANVEMVVKVLNGCALSGHHWVFAGGLTDVRVVWTVRDTLTNATRTYTNPRGTPFRPVQDTAAFASCP